MGIYFIAAGKISKNRCHTLEKAWKVSELSKFLPPEISSKLQAFFPKGDGVYLWGANRMDPLQKVREGEYVVDVKNKEIVQVFQFCFWFKALNTNIQSHVGWDGEKPKHERRPYFYIYFLRNPLRTVRTEKKYFQSAFAEEGNQNWLVGQRYFDDLRVRKARLLTGTTSEEQFLGISGESVTGPTASLLNRSGSQVQDVRHRPRNESTSKSEFIDPPKWLAPVVARVKALHEDPKHLERDHEGIVASFFEALGYMAPIEIKYQRGSIDIRIDEGGSPLATVEVKADWALSSQNKSALDQAFSYAYEAETRFVIITNADRYFIYDQDRKGYSYTQKLYAEFQLTALTISDLAKIESLRKGTWSQKD